MFCRDDEGEVWGEFEIRCEMMMMVSAAAAAARRLDIFLMIVLRMECNGRVDEAWK